MAAASGSTLRSRLLQLLLLLELPLAPPLLLLELASPLPLLLLLSCNALLAGGRSGPCAWHRILLPLCCLRLLPQLRVQPACDHELLDSCRPSACCGSCSAGMLLHLLICTTAGGPGSAHADTERLG